MTSVFMYLAPKSKLDSVDQCMARPVDARRFDASKRRDHRQLVARHYRLGRESTGQGGGMRFGSVNELWRYPVSSLSGEMLEEAAFDGTGVAGDRQWGLFDIATRVVAGPESERRWRPVPAMRSRSGGAGPEMTSDGAAWHAVPSAAADAAASAHLGFAVGFSRFEAGNERAAPRYERGNLHIVTTASLARLKDLLPNAVIDTRRFRPNILIETDAGEEGFAEQRLVGRRLAIGSTLVEITEPCTRCAFTALGQLGIPFDKDVLHTIAKHGEGGFGVLARVATQGIVRLGDDATLV
jgi:uncharacterized protein YcbX